MPKCNNSGERPESRYLVLFCLQQGACLQPEQLSARHRRPSESHNTPWHTVVMCHVQQLRHLLQNSSPPQAPAEAYCWPLLPADTFLATDVFKTGLTSSRLRSSSLSDLSLLQRNFPASRTKFTRQLWAYSRGTRRWHIALPSKINYVEKKIMVAASNFLRQY